MTGTINKINIKPATYDRWDDLQEVFGPRGAYDGCWCMYWRIKRKEMGQLGVKGRRLALKKLTGGTSPPGIIYYDRSTPIAWCAVGPREDFSVLQRSPTLKPVDDRPTWSMVCFFIIEEYRGRGLFREMVKRALDYAKRSGAERIEAYPKEGVESGTWAYMGIADVYRSLGFREVARRKLDRPVLRMELASS